MTSRGVQGRGLFTNCRLDRRRAAGGRRADRRANPVGFASNARGALRWGKDPRFSGNHAFSLAIASQIADREASRRNAMRTQIGIVGAGPAGLMLSHLLEREGIDSVVLEARSRDYIEGRIRAGVIEQWVADLLVEIGLGARMQRAALIHRGINLSFSKTLHHLDFQKLVGKSVTVYGQQEVVKNLIAARLAAGGAILFEVSDVSVGDLSTKQPTIYARHGGQVIEIIC